MPDVMAIVSKAIFEKTARGKGVGSLWPTQAYHSGNKQLEKLGTGGRLFLVTVRPTPQKGEALWLVGVLESPSFDGEAWTASRNRRPIADITALKDQLRFESGKGIAAGKGSLAMSLQTPRVLTTADSELLLGAAPTRAPKPPRPPGPANVARHEEKSQLPCLCKRCFADAKDSVDLDGETYIRGKVEVNGRILWFWLPAVLRDELGDIAEAVETRLRKRLPPWQKKSDAASAGGGDDDGGDDDGDDDE